MLELQGGWAGWYMGARLAIGGVRGSVSKHGLQEQEYKKAEIFK